MRFQLFVYDFCAFIQGSDEQESDDPKSDRCKPHSSILVSANFMDCRLLLARKANLVAMSLSIVKRQVQCGFNAILDPFQISQGFFRLLFDVLKFGNVALDKCQL